ncbi:hypothetical protein O181_009285 [Austropuccinia psidii MF-1]|uniref:ShKT domain-containing protein n=1 Tax=Austropuccinia psidii MF-1 TaxID=1389203 RepID=A0A9Q3GJR7_9BASI|nr:hypothetical protein [Austropuccinia psidii MF-1]
MYLSKVGVCFLLQIGSYGVAAMIRCDSCHTGMLQEKLISITCSAEVKCMNNNCENMVLAGCTKKSLERRWVCSADCGNRQHFYICHRQHQVQKRCKSCEEAEVPDCGSATSSPTDT